MRIALYVSLGIGLCEPTNRDVGDVVGGGYSTTATSANEIVTVGMNASQASFAFAQFVEAFSTRNAAMNRTLIASIVKKMREPLRHLINGIGSSISSDGPSIVVSDSADVNAAATTVFSGGINLSAIALNAAREAVNVGGPFSMGDIEILQGSGIVAQVVQTIKSHIVDNNLSPTEQIAPLSVVADLLSPGTSSSTPDDPPLTGDLTIYTQMCVDSKSALQNAFTKYMRFAKISDQAVVRQTSAPNALTSYVYRCTWRNDAWVYGYFMRGVLGPLFELQSSIEEACGSGGLQGSIPTAVEMIKMKATQYMVRLISALVDVAYKNYVTAPMWYCPIAWYADMYNQPDARACYDFTKLPWQFVNTPGLIETQKRFYTIYSDIALTKSPWSTDLSKGGFSTSESDLKNLYSFYSDTFDECEKVATKYTNMMAAYQYDNQWYVSDLTSDEISYYKLMSICRVDNKPILDKASSIAQIQAKAASLYAANPVDVSAPVFSCVNNMINTVTKDRVTQPR